MAGTQASEATPFFERLYPAMTNGVHDAPAQQANGAALAAPSQKDESGAADQPSRPPVKATFGLTGESPWPGAITTTGVPIFARL